MSSLGVFLALSALLAIALAAVAFYPWLKRARIAGRSSLMGLNVELFQARLAELEADFAQGGLDEADYAEQKLELERQLLAATADVQTSQSAITTPKKPITLLAVFASAGLMLLAYAALQDRTGVFALWQAQQHMNALAGDMLTGKTSQPPPEFMQGDVQKNSLELIQAMQTMVYKQAQKPDHWMNLSQAYMALEDVPSALEALGRARRLKPHDHDIAMTYAQVRFFSGGGQLDDQSRQTLSEVLHDAPNHEGAQMLMAMGEVKAQNYSQAQYWTARLKRTLQDKQSERGGDRSAALASLDELEATIQAKQQQKQQIEAASAASAIQVQVRLADSLKPKLVQMSDNSALFVVVRAEAGGAPYAVKRLPLTSVRDALTTGFVTVRLSDGDSMLPERNISNAKRDKIPLVLTAKISQAGMADATTGDFLANPVSVPAPATEAKTSSKAPAVLTIDKTY